MILLRGLMKQRSLLLLQQYFIKSNRVYASRIYTDNEPNTIHQNKIYFASKFNSENRNASHFVISFTNEEEVDLDTNYIHFFKENEIKHRYSSMIELLYPLSVYPIINRLKNCDSINDVLNICDEFKGNFTKEQICQTILMIRIFQKQADSIKSASYKTTSNFDIQNITNLPSFKQLLVKLDTVCEQMNFQELCNCLICLRNFNIKLKDNEIMRKMITSSKKFICETPPNDLCLKSLYQFCLTVRSFPSVWCVFTLKNVISVLIQRLETLDNYEDLKNFTLCLQKVIVMVHDDFLERFKETSVNLLTQHHADDDLEILRIRTALTVIISLDRTSFTGTNVATVRSLLKSLSGSLHLLNSQDLFTIYRLVGKSKEPNLLQNELIEICDKWISNYKQGANDLFMLFLCSVVHKYKFEDGRPELISHAKSYLSKPVNEQSLLGLNLIYFMMRSGLCKISNMIDIYWKAVTAAFQNDANRNVERIIWYCKRYLVFCQMNNRLRCVPFEKAAVSWLLGYMNEYDIFVRPILFSKIGMLLFTFEVLGTLDKPLPSSTVDKICCAIRKVNTHDSIIISFFAMLIFKHMSHNRSLYRDYHQDFMGICSALNDNVQQSLNYDQNTSVIKLNVMLTGINRRQAPRNPELINAIIQRYGKSATVDGLDSMLIKDAIINFQVCKIISPEFLSTSMNFCLKFKDIIPSTTTNKLLDCLFVFGFLPEQNFDIFLTTTIDLLMRDLNRTGSLSILQTSLALCYFSFLPQSLVNHIFNTDFLKCVHRFNDETKMFELTKLNLMQLNRAVCIEYPEYGVPWFHEDSPFFQNSRSLDVRFHEDVYNTLGELVKDKNFIEINHQTPYKYNIDFLICLKNDGTPVSRANFTDPSVTRVAVLLEMSGSPKQYYPGKGRSEMKYRHIEMLNYKLITVKSYLWNSMYMSEPNAKLSHLRSIIWPTITDQSHVTQRAAKY